MTKPTRARHVRYIRWDPSAFRHACNQSNLYRYHLPMLIFFIRSLTIFFQWISTWWSVCLQALHQSVSLGKHGFMSVFRFGCLGWLHLQSSSIILEPTNSGENGQTIHFVCRAWYVEEALGGKVCIGPPHNQGEAAADCLNQVIEGGRYMEFFDKFDLVPVS